MQPEIQTPRAFFRHALATLAYRTGKTLRSPSANFATFKIGEQSRTPEEIIAHMADLMAWSYSMARGENKWNPAAPQGWTAETERFYRQLKHLDDYLASDEPLHCEIERLFQGPLADALTHAGQLAMLRHLAGCPIQGENYFVAEIVTGVVGAEQAVPIRTF